MITCLIRYEIDPFQREAFRTYAEHWGRIIPRCGGHLLGYFLPHEGTNDVAWALIGFADLASYERYRTTLRSDPEGRANFDRASRERFIRREERTFVAAVEGTVNRPPATPRPAVTGDRGAPQSRRTADRPAGTRTDASESASPHRRRRPPRR